jgi:hypothetical protein
MRTCCVLLLSGLLFCLLPSCKKDAPPPDFSQITVTDSTCLLIGDTDNTDWTFDDYWMTGEYQLLKFIDTNAVATDTSIGWVQIHALCPNPNNGIFIWDFATEYPAKMKLAVVNTKFRVLYYEAITLTGGSSAVSYDFRYNHSFHQGENYRIYYGFYNSRDSLYYKGHGDFRTE